jgi:hypothetical protein
MSPKHVGTILGSTCLYQRCVVGVMNEHFNQTSLNTATTRLRDFRTVTLRH